MNYVWIVFLIYHGEMRFSAAFSSEEAARDYAGDKMNVLIKRERVYDSADEV